MPFSFRNKFVVSFLCLFTLIGVFFYPATAAEVKLIFLHSSDVHGHIGPQPDPISLVEPRPMIGGYAALKTCLDRIRLEAVKNGSLALYFDTGDFFQGTPIVDHYKGACMIDLMNQVRTFGAEIGNHDVDYGLDKLKEEIKKAKFPILCCNVFETSTKSLLPHVRSSFWFSFKGKKIAIIGVITPDTPKIAIEENIRGLEFKDPIPILKRMIPEFRKRGADLIVLLSHMGIEEDRRLAQTDLDVDLILGGHSHWPMKKLEYQGSKPTAIAHPAYDNRIVSKVEVTLEDGKKPCFSFTPISLFLSDYPEDSAIKKVTDEYRREIAHEMDEVIGNSDVDLVRGVVGGDSQEGSFIADAMREFTGSDFAFINAGGVRYPIFKGPITMETIFMLQPFSNTIDVLTMNGKEIVHLVECAISTKFSEVNEDDREYGIENFRIIGKGLKRNFSGEFGYIMPSNLHITFDPQLSPFSRVIKISDADGRPLAPERLYKVALTSFMVDGGDGYAFLKKYPLREKTNFIVRDLIVKKIKKDGGIKKLPEQRMFNLKLSITPIPPQN